MSDYVPVGLDSDSHDYLNTNGSRKLILKPKCL